MFCTDLDRRMRFFEDASAHNDRNTKNTFMQAYNPVRLVFNTTELLELILLELDMKTVLLSQATNHMFHQTIITSPRIRQKLWFDPDPRLATAGEQASLNPLVQSVVTKGKHSHIRFLELEYASLDFYPALSRRLKPFEPPTVCVAMAPHARAANWNGSWRRMLAVQPYDLSTRWDAYHYRWATRDWDFRFTGTFGDDVPSMERVVRFAHGPGFEAKDT